MTKKIFRGSLLASAVILAVSFAIVLTCLYNYFSALQEKQLRLELDLAVRGMARPPGPAHHLGGGGRHRAL